MKPKINPPNNQGTKPTMNRVTKIQPTKQATKQHNARSLTSQNTDRHTSMHVDTETRTVYLHTHA